MDLNTNVQNGHVYMVESVLSLTCHAYVAFFVSTKPREWNSCCLSCHVKILYLVYISFITTLLKHLNEFPKKKGWKSSS